VFPSDQVASTPVPITALHSVRPGLHVEFNFYRGKPGDADARSIPVAREGLKPTLIEALDASGLFSHYSLAPDRAEPGDYVLKLKLYNHSPMVASVASGMVTGATLFIVPGVAKDNFTLTGELLDPALRPVAQHRNVDSIKTWIGIWFLPFMGHTTGEAINDTFTRQINELLRILVAEQPALQVPG
jgi:hypothetical protein